MILTVTLNPAVDHTLQLDEELSPDAVARTDDAQFDPGGKGINVSKYLVELDVETVATGYVGDFLGRGHRSDKVAQAVRCSGDISNKFGGGFLGKLLDHFFADENRNDLFGQDRFLGGGFCGRLGDLGAGFFRTGKRSNHGCGACRYAEHGLSHGSACLCGERAVAGWDSVRVDLRLETRIR